MTTSVGRSLPHSCIDRQSAEDIPEFKLKLLNSPANPNAQSTVEFHNALSLHVPAGVLAFPLVRGDYSHSKGGRPGGTGPLGTGYGVGFGDSIREWVDVEIFFLG